MIDRSRNPGIGLGQTRAEKLEEAMRVLVPVAELYLEAFTPDDKMNILEAMRLTEVEETVEWYRANN